MRQLHLSKHAVTAASLVCFGTALLIAGCGGGNTSVSQVTPSSPLNGATAPAGSGSSTSCASMTNGVAYLSDGIGSGVGSLTMIPFESRTGVATRCQPTVLTLPESISDFVIAPFGNGVALGADGGLLGLGGFVSGQQPFTQGMPPSNSPLKPTSLAIVTNGTAGFSVAPDSSPTAGFNGFNNLLGNAPAPTPVPPPTTPPLSPTASPAPTPFVAPTSVSVTPPPYANNVPYISIGATPPHTSTGLNASGTRGSVALGPDGATILVRGVSDLITFQLQTTIGGYVIGFPADTSSNIAVTNAAKGESTALGFATAPTAASGTYAHGLMAFFPANPAQAIIGGASGNAGAVTIVSGMPTSLTASPSVTVPNGAAVSSVAVNIAGSVVAVGTANGLYTYGVSGNTLSAINSGTASTQSFTASNGSSIPLASVISVGISPDSKYVAALVGEGGTGHDSLLIIPVDQNGKLGTVAQTINNLDPTTGDFMVVR